MRKYILHCNFSVHGSLPSAHAIVSLIVGMKVGGAVYCAQSSWFTIRPLCIYLDVTRLKIFLNDYEQAENLA
jgi:hypothetical protein